MSPLIPATIPLLCVRTKNITLKAIWEFNGVKVSDVEGFKSAIEDGKNVLLLADIELTNPIKIEKNVLIDLNNHSITANGVRALHFASGLSKITGTGTISATPAALGSSAISIGENANAELTIDSDVTVNSSTAYCITVFGSGTETLTVKGKVISTAPTNVNYDGCAISTVGTDDTPATITIKEGAVISAVNTNAIYMPSGNLKVEGGTITGLTGIYVKSNNTTITGGTVKGTGTKVDYNYYSNGGISTGDALVVDNCNYPNGAPTVSISGGTFISDNAYAVGSYAKTSYTSITGFIKGGTFSSNPSSYLADGYKAVEENGKYKVVAK